MACWESKADKELNESEARKGEQATVKPLGDFGVVGADRPLVRNGSSATGRASSTSMLEQAPGYGPLWHSRAGAALGA